MAKIVAQCLAHVEVGSDGAPDLASGPALLQLPLHLLHQFLDCRQFIFRQLGKILVTQDFPRTVHGYRLRFRFLPIRLGLSGRGLLPGLLGRLLFDLAKLLKERFRIQLRFRTIGPPEKIEDQIKKGKVFVTTDQNRSGAVLDISTPTEIQVFQKFRQVKRQLR